MAGLLVEVAEAVRGVQCELLAANQYIVGSVGRINPPLRNRALTSLSGIRRLLGCSPAGDVGEPPPPFNGGQCPGVRYSLSFSGSLRSASQCANPADPGFNVSVSGAFGCTSAVPGNQIFGPIVGVFSVPQTPPNASGFQNIVIRARTATGAPNDFVIATNHCPAKGGFNVTLSNIQRCSGTEDCGSPPVVYPPPTTFNRDINITYNTDEGDEVTVTIPFIFAPIEVNFDGTLRIPFSFDFGGNTFNGNFSLADELPISFNFPGLPPGSGQGTEDLPPDAPGETVDPVPPEEKIIGVVVNVTDTESSRVSAYSSPNIPPIFTPRLGSVKFAYSIGAATFWSSDIDIKDRRTFIECPFSQGADAVVASPQTGVALTFVPIRGFPLATTRDISDRA